jgi:ABC-type microcin C transport system duplicated ATPase subunit YejF
MQLLRGKSVAMIFQEPMTSLNPLMTVGQQLEETLQRHEVLGRRERRSRSARCWTRSKSVMWRSACNSIRTSFPAVCASG